MNDTQNPSLSLVITAYTTERLGDIYELLESITNQTLQNMETIFVIERSQELLDRINAFIEENAISNVKTVFSGDRLGLSLARNLGIEHAKGEIIGFVDDDVVLYPDWAEKMMETYKTDSVVGVTGPGYPLWEDENMNWLPKEFYWIVSCTAFTGWNGVRSVRSAWGMNMSFRREAFELCRFSPDFGHTEGGKEAWKTGPVDDAEFSMNLRIRSGKNIMYNPKVQVYHNVYKYRLSKKFIRSQSYWQGYSKAIFRKMYPDDEDTRKLVRERDVLKRIIFRLFPRSIMGLFTKPASAGRTIGLTCYVLYFVALGYSSGAYSGLFGFTKRWFVS